MLQKIYNCINNQYEKLYADGWPEEYIGKSVNEIGSWHENFQPVRSAAEMMQSQSVKSTESSSFCYTFTTAERNPGTNRATGEAVNAEYGSSNWMFEEDIYSVAREHGTD